MDYAFFEGLTAAEADAHLAAFLAEGRERVDAGWWDRLSADGVDAIEPYFADFAPRLEVIQVPPPDDLPGFVVRSMYDHHGGFQDFAHQEDRIAVLTAAFYFGEAFRESFPALTWAVGRRDRAETGQPVVTGFTSDADLPVLEVTENLAMVYRDDPSRVATATASWKPFAPA